MPPPFVDSSWVENRIFRPAAGEGIGFGNGVRTKFCFHFMGIRGAAGGDTNTETTMSTCAKLLELSCGTLGADADIPASKHKWLGEARSSVNGRSLKRSITQRRSEPEEGVPSPRRPPAGASITSPA